MRNYVVAFSSVLGFLFGCSHAQSSISPLVGTIRPYKNHAVMSPDSPLRSFTVLYSFKGGPDGGSPTGDLVLDQAGNLYGTTPSGGNPTCFQTGGCGVIFKIDSSGNETVLHSFDGTDGQSPYGGLVQDAAGNMFGTTAYGGSGNSCSQSCGVVFKLDPNGNYSVLYNFLGYPTDGSLPYADLLLDAAGNLYSSTFMGGPSGQGTVFRLDSRGRESLLYSFKGVAHGDGQLPGAGVVQDAAGNLYGTTEAGGASGFGIVFKLDSNGNETLLHNFVGKDGRVPRSSLEADGAGNLYGTTIVGDGSSCPYHQGCGVVFKIEPSGHETTFHVFGNDGGNRPVAGLIRSRIGNFFGTTSSGGPSHLGVVFELDRSGTETVLHVFHGLDGADPTATMVKDSAGNLYGTTASGGSSGHGVVFKLTH